MNRVYSALYVRLHSTFITCPPIPHLETVSQILTENVVRSDTIFLSHNWLKMAKIVRYGAKKHV